MNIYYRAVSLLLVFGCMVWAVLQFQSSNLEDSSSTSSASKAGNQPDPLSDSSSGTFSPRPLSSILVPGFDTVVARNGGIAYVQSDLLATRFNLMVRKRNALQARLQKAEKEWEGEAARFRQEIEDFQRNGAAMGESQRQATEQMLTRKEQNLMQMREGIVGELSKSESVVDQELRVLLDQEFEIFSKARGYRFLMARQAGSGLLYGDSIVDVTDQLIGYLNSRYP